MLDAQAALALGLVIRVVRDEELGAVSLTLRFAEGPRLAHVHLKRILHAEETEAFADWLDIEAEAQAICAATQDHREAAIAFTEGRAPRFTPFKVL